MAQGNLTCSNMLDQKYPRWMLQTALLQFCKRKSQILYENKKVHPTEKKAFNSKNCNHNS